MVASSIILDVEACHGRQGRAHKRDRDLRAKGGAPRQPAKVAGVVWAPRSAPDEDEGSTTAEENIPPKECRPGKKPAQTESEPAKLRREHKKDLKLAKPMLADDSPADSRREAKMEEKRSRTEARQAAREAALRSRSKASRRNCRSVGQGAAPVEPAALRARQGAREAEDEDEKEAAEEASAALGRRQQREERRVAYEAELWELQQLEQLEAEAEAAIAATRAFAEVFDDDLDGWEIV